MKVRYQPPSPQPVWASSPLRSAPGPSGFASRPVVPSVPKNGLLSSPLCFYRVNSVLPQLNASFYCCCSCLTSCHQGHCLPWAPLLLCHLIPSTIPPPSVRLCSSIQPFSSSHPLPLCGPSPIGCCPKCVLSQDLYWPPFICDLSSWEGWYIVGTLFLLPISLYFTLPWGWP